MAGLCFNSGELAAACVLACAQHSNNPQLAAHLVNESRTVAEHPAWTAKQRPASAVQQLEMQWQLPLQQLKTAAEEPSPGSVRSKQVWQGQCFELWMAIDTSSTGKLCTHIALCLAVEGSVACVQSMTSTLSILSAPGSNQQQQAASKAAIKSTATGILKS
jgi:hypothetical protein